MEDHEFLKRQVLNLRLAGVTTPEICRNLSLDLDTVLAWLINEQLVHTVAFLDPEEPVRSSHKKYNWVHLSTIMSRLSEPASRYGYSGDLWTPCRLISQFNLPRGTAYRWIEKTDLTFSKRLRSQFLNKGQYQRWITTILPKIAALVERRKALLYLLDELRPEDCPNADIIWESAQDCEESEAGDPVFIYGISSTGRIAGQLHWCRKRAASEQVLQVLQGFLSIHSQRKVVILARMKSTYRTRSIQNFLEQQPNLRLITF